MIAVTAPSTSSPPTRWPRERAAHIGGTAEIDTSEHGSASSYRSSPDQPPNWLEGGDSLALVSIDSDVAMLSSISSQLEDLGHRITEMAERYGATPDSRARERAVRRRTRPHRSSAVARSRSEVPEPDLIGALPHSKGRRADAREPASIATRLARDAHLATVLDQAQREQTPLLRRRPWPSRSCSIFTGSVSAVSLQAMRQPGHMRVDRQARDPEPNRAHDVAGLAADAGQRHEIVELGRDLATESLLDRLRHPDQALRLRAEEPRRVDQLLDLVGIGVGKVGRRRVAARTAPA